MELQYGLVRETWIFQYTMEFSFEGDNIYNLSGQINCISSKTYYILYLTKYTQDFLTPESLKHRDVPCVEYKSDPLEIRVHIAKQNTCILI